MSLTEKSEKTTGKSIVESLDEDQLKNAIAFLSNESSALSNGRSGTIYEANGRTTIFLTTISSSLVALAFIGQVSQMGQAFYVFSLVLFPCLIFLGFATYHRALQTTVEDMTCNIGLLRIRHFYVEVVPQLKDYLVLATSDDLQAAGEDDGVRNYWWQLFVTTAGMIAVINAVLIGVTVGLVAGAVGFGLWLGVIAGIIIGLVVLFWEMYYQTVVWKRVNDRYKPKFPRKDAEKRPDPAR